MEEGRELAPRFDADGLILTIGYLMLEAEQIELKLLRIKLANKVR